jgi:hypothetical protein
MEAQNVAAIGYLAHQIDIEWQRQVSSVIMRYKPDDLKAFLDEKVEAFNKLDFIEHDPVSIPHLFSKKQDIEIADQSH